MAEQKREYYPEGLYEFDTFDRSAPGENPPAMLRLELCGKYDVLCLMQQLLSWLANEDGKFGPTFTFSGKLIEVDE